MKKVVIVGCGSYMDPETFAKTIEDKTGINVIAGTHDYH